MPDLWRQRLAHDRSKALGCTPSFEIYIPRIVQKSAATRMQLRQIKALVHEVKYSSLHSGRADGSRPSPTTVTSDGAYHVIAEPLQTSIDTDSNLLSLFSSDTKRCSSLQPLYPRRRVVYRSHQVRDMYIASIAPSILDSTFSAW